jgi:hypothetical protein
MAAKKKGQASISPERLAEIRASVESGRGRSMFDDPTPAMNRFHGPMCRCGVHRKGPGLARHSADDGRCTVHPEARPEPYVRGVSGSG